MIELKNVDLVIIDSVNPYSAIETLNFCTQKIIFGNSYLFTHINIDTQQHKLMKIQIIDNIHKYSDFCLQLNKYLNNDFVLIIQNDGFIINPHLWSNDFLNYDYIGSPWMQTSVIGQKVGNGGFSLRSKKFLKFSSKFKTTNNVPEDNFLCIDNYNEALKFGIKYADSEIANKFSFESRNIYSEIFEPEKHFGFHGKHNLEIVNKYINN